MNLTSLNHLVAVEPFPTRSSKSTTMRGGLIGVAQKVELQALKVVLPSKDGAFLPGMTVFVRGDLCAQDFAANIQEIGDKTFILLPDSYVLLVQDECQYKYGIT